MRHFTSLISLVSSKSCEVLNHWLCVYLLRDLLCVRHKLHCDKQIRLSLRSWTLPPTSRSVVPIVDLPFPSKRKLRFKGSLLSQGHAAPKSGATIQTPVCLPRLSSFHSTILPSYRKLNLWFHLKYEETSGILVFNHIADTESEALRNSPVGSSLRVGKSRKELLISSISLPE